MDNNTLEFIKIFVPAFVSIIVATLGIVKYVNVQIEKSRTIERALWEKNLNDLSNAREEARQELKEAQHIIEDNQSELIELKTTLARADESVKQVPELIKRVAQLEEKVQRLENDNGKLAEENSRLRVENQKQKTVIEAYETAFSLMNKELE